MAWTWQIEGAAGDSLDVHALLASDVADEPAGDPAAPVSFPNQGDAESWLGENWRALHGAGAVRATLFEEGRKVYGPMPLEP